MGVHGVRFLLVGLDDQVEVGDGWCLLVGLDPVRVVEGRVFVVYSVFL